VWLRGEPVGEAAVPGPRDAALVYSGLRSSALQRAMPQEEQGGVDSGSSPGPRGTGLALFSQGQLAVQSASHKGWVGGSQKNAFSINNFRLMVWGTRRGFLFFVFLFFPFLGYILYKPLKARLGQVWDEEQRVGREGQTEGVSKRTLGNETEITSSTLTEVPGAEGRAN